LRLRRYFTEQAPAGVDSAYLFGSHAGARAHRESDVDVAVLLDHAAYPTSEARFDARVRLSSALISALHHNRVDVVVLNDVPPELGRRVVHDGLRVYIGDSSHDHAYVLHGVERLTELRRYLEHLRALKPQVKGAADLERDLSLHNDVLFSLLTVVQLVVNVACLRMEAIIM
jgi:predicted nucleotidyltransferase